MTILERIGIEIAGGLLAIVAALIFWHVHNLDEQKLGASSCIQSTTIDRTEAKADVASDTQAQKDFLTKVVSAYDAKVSSLQSANDDLARRLSDGAVRASRLSDPGAAACKAPALAGLSESETAAQQRLGRIRADLKFVLDACDANQVKTEDAAAAYDALRDRAIDAQKKAPK